MIKYGVWRNGGIDHREYSTYLPLKSKLENKGNQLLFYEYRAGTGNMAGWDSSKNIRIKKSTLQDIKQCDILDFADCEVLSKVKINDIEKEVELLEIIPRDIKVIVTINSPESLKQFNSVSQDRISAFVLKWNFPIPPQFKLNKIYRIKHAMDTEFWRPLLVEHNKDQFAIHYAGQMTYSKGLGELISAFSYANDHDKNIILRLAGYDPAGAGAYYAKKHSGAIEYIGFTTWGDNIAMFLNNGDVFCQTNFTNQGAHSTLEALCCGLPILTINNNYMEKEVIEDGKNGYICEDEYELASKFIELSYDRELVKQMGQYSRLKALKEFSEETSLNTTISNLRKAGIDI